MLRTGCGQENPADAAFCMSFGEALKRVCSGCGTPASLEALHCNSCGEPLEIGLEERKRILGEYLQAELALGGGHRIESRLETSAVVLRSQRVNHLLHLILSVLTGGLWLVVWIYLVVADSIAALHVRFFNPEALAMSVRVLFPFTIVVHKWNDPSLAFSPHGSASR